MAVSKKVMVRIAADDKTKQAFDSAERRTKKLNKAFSILGKTAAASFAAMATGAVAAAVGFARFEKAMAEVSTLVDTSTVDMKKLSNETRKLSKEFGSSPTEQAKALYQIISSGAEAGAEAIEVLRASNLLAIGGVTDMTTAADGLTTVINAWGKEANTTAQISDIFFTAMQHGKTTVGEMGENIGQVGDLAAQLGLKFGEVAIAAATVTKAGKTTSEAMTGLQGVMRAVLIVTPKAALEAERLGLDFSTAALRAKGLKGFLDSVAEAVKGDEVAMGKLFGRVEGLKTIMGLTGVQADDFAKGLDLLTTNTGKTEEAAGKLQDTLIFKWDLIKTNIKSVGDTIAESVNPEMKIFLDWVNKGVQGFAQMISAERSIEIKRLLNDLSVEMDNITSAMNAPTSGIFEKAFSEERMRRLIDNAQTVNNEMARLERELANIGTGAVVFKNLDENFKDMAKSIKDAVVDTNELKDKTDGLKDKTEELKIAVVEVTDSYDRLGKTSKFATQIANDRLEENRQAVVNIQDALNELMEDDALFGFGEAATESQRAWEQAAEGVQDAWVGMFQDLFQGEGLDSVKDFLKSVKNLFLNIIAEIAAKWAASKIFGIGGGGNILGSIGSIFSGGGGGGGGAGSVLGPVISKLFGIGGASTSSGAGIAGGAGGAGGAGIGAAALPIAFAVAGTASILSGRKKRAAERARVQTEAIARFKTGKLRADEYFISLNNIEGKMSDLSPAFKTMGADINTTFEQGGTTIVNFTGNLAGAEKAALSYSQEVKDWMNTQKQALADMSENGRISRDITKQVSEEWAQSLTDSGKSLDDFTIKTADLVAGLSEYEKRLNSLDGTVTNVTIQETTRTTRTGRSQEEGGFALGGSFKVKGSGGTDSQDVRFKATPGEKVTIQTPGQQSRSNDKETARALNKLAVAMEANTNVLRQAVRAH